MKKQLKVENNTTNQPLQYHESELKPESGSPLM